MTDYYLALERLHPNAQNGQLIDHLKDHLILFSFFFAEIESFEYFLNLFQRYHPQKQECGLEPSFGVDDESVFLKQMSPLVPA